jgi:AcrR family transcriptional regulator
MAEPAPVTENNEGRRFEMLRAALELICERGFGETHIADVAKRAGVSSALVIYYFGTRDRLPVDALSDPHLTHHVRLFHIAHHDGLQPTQHVVD